MKLLLAEDEPDVQLIARLALKRAKFQVVTVNNGIEVLEAVAADQPDVILLGQGPGIGSGQGAGAGSGGLHWQAIRRADAGRPDQVDSGKVGT